MALAHRSVRGLAWLLISLTLWVVALPVAWLLVNGAHMGITGAREPPTSFWEVAVLSYLYAGLLPLAVVLIGLWHVGRRGRPSFRPTAIVTSLLFGGLFGFYLILLTDPAIQTVLGAWAAFGALVPRPPNIETAGRESTRLASPTRPAAGVSGSP